MSGEKQVERNMAGEKPKTRLGQLASTAICGNDITSSCLYVSALTSYVGVTGLVKRMTLDRCMPQFLLKKTKRGT